MFVARRLTRSPISSRLRQKITSGMSANGIPNESATCEMMSALEGLTPIASTIERRRHRDDAAQEERDLAVDVALHHDLAGERADARGREARGEQRDAEDDVGVATDDRPEPAVGLVDVADLRQAARVEDARGHDQHGHVDEPGDRHRDHDVDLLEAEDAPALVGVGADDAALRERGVEVDDVRHDRRAEDAGGQQHALGVREARRQQALDGRAAVGVRVTASGTRSRRR